MESRFKIGKANLALNLKARLKINLAFFICGLRLSPRQAYCQRLSSSLHHRVEKFGGQFFYKDKIMFQKSEGKIQYRKKFLQLRKYRNYLLQHSTDAEKKFKKILISLNLKFNEQHIFINLKCNCIVDFYLPRPLRIVFEIDGKQHNINDWILINDVKKEIFMFKRHFVTYRFKNEDIFYKTEEVKKDVITIIKNQMKQKGVTYLNTRQH